jgi:hypothetical protein
MTRHERFAAGKDTVGIPVQPVPALEQRAAAEPAEQTVAEDDADERACSLARLHPEDVVIPLRREHAERDQRGLARQRDAEGLDQNGDEEKWEAVVGEELG